jgi:small-conductance mechanosensitive channel
LSRAFFVRVESGRITMRGFYPEWAKPTHRLVSVAIVAAAAIIAYPYIPGSGSDAFKGVTVFVGLLVSLGSSSIIGNLLNGFVITYMRAFKQHDVIQLAGTMGEVVETTLLVTRLRTVEGVEITVPNGQVLAGHVSNFSKAGAPLVSTSVTIGYDVPWRRVEELLVSAALKVDQVKNTPAPYVLKRALLDHAIAYELFFVVADSRNVPLAVSRVNEEVLDAFNAADVQIMSPRYVFDPAEPKVVRQAGRAAPHVSG